jgi:CubicO group peptidase (beta-lactamase class C family)
MKNVSSLLLFMCCALSFSANANFVDNFSHFNKQTPGCAIGVVKEGALVYENYFGQANLRYQVPIDKSTVFNLGSITKHLTAALALQLEVKGQLSLNDSLTKYYPQGPDWFNDIKLHHLIQHQSGLPDYLNDRKTRDELVKAVSKVPNILEQLTVGKPITHDVVLKHVIALIMALPTPLLKPSEKADYSNTGYLLLANIIARSSGMPFNELAQNQLFKPLAMTSTELMSVQSIEIPWSATGYDVLNASSYKYRRNSPNLISKGSGGLLSTLPDFAKWVSHLMAPETNKLFWKEFLKLKKTSSILSGAYYNNGLSMNYVKGKAVYSHSGLSIDSMRSNFWFSPDHKIGYIQLCNTNFNYRPPVTEIIEKYGA